MSEMTIKDAVLLKLNLEDAIRRGIDEFTKKTGVMVESVRIDTLDVSRYGGPKEFAYEVKVETVL
jgi:hypothetical protein